MERLANDTVSVHQFPFYFIGIFFFSREPDNVHEPLKKPYRVFLILTYQVRVKHVPRVSKYHNSNTKYHKLNWKTSIWYKSLNIFWEVPPKNTKNEAETWKTRTKFPAGSVWAKITITLTKFNLQIGPRCCSSPRRHVELNNSHREVWDKKSRMFGIVRYMSRWHSVSR